MTVDFSANPSVEALRAEIRHIVAREIDQTAAARVADTGTFHEWGLHRALAQGGHLASALPEAFGGTGRDAEHLAALFDELELLGAPFDGVSNVMMVSFVLGQIGSDVQRSEILPRLLDGSQLVCLGYSEPGSGSDVAAATTKARRVGGGWVIDGQKMFTSLAEEAHWCFLLARTDPQAAKHRGLTFFLVPMDSPGVEVREMRTLSHKRTNTTFFDGVTVDDRFRVGEVNGGWDVMMVALPFERGAAGGTSGTRRLWKLLQERFEADPDLRGEVLQDPAHRDKLARIAVECEVSHLLAQRCAWVASTGRVPGQEGSEAKLFATESLVRASRTLMDVFGSQAVRTDTPLGDFLSHAYRHSPVTTVYGGTSEIQKNIIAERGLGLPRAR